MAYKLKEKENAFQVTREGKFEYRRYKHGETYDEVPPEDLQRFEEIQAAVTNDPEGSRQTAEGRKNKK